MIDTSLILQAHNLKLLMYEGGPGLETSRNDGATLAAIAFNRHDAMEEAVREVLEAWYSIVGADPYNTHPGKLVLLCCCVVLCCVVLCCVVLCCVALRCVALRCVALRCAALRCVALCCVVL